MSDVLVYFALIAIWSFAVTYLFLFGVLPALSGRTRVAHHAAPLHPAKTAKVVHHAAPAARTTGRQLSRREGFKSLATGPTLSVEDIVTGLSRNGR